MKLKSIIKKHTLLNHKLCNPTKCLRCDMHFIYPNGRVGCNVFDDYVDDFSYECPKEDGQHMYCEKHKTYCWKENTCDFCPIE